MKNEGYASNRSRTLLSACIIAAAAIVVAIVVTVTIVKGVGSALPAIFSGAAFIVILALYWLRKQKGVANGVHHH
jgi:lipopolysaccharide export LptBFGC system permease protein LptF